MGRCKVAVGGGYENVCPSLHSPPCTGFHEATLISTWPSCQFNHNTNPLTRLRHLSFNGAMGLPVSDRQTSAAFSARYSAKNGRSRAHASPPTLPASSERSGKPPLEGLGIRLAAGIRAQEERIASPEPETNVVPDRVEFLNAPGHGALILPCPFAVGESNPKNGATKEIPLLCQRRTFKSIARLK
jgi:hypothetical protein